MFRVADIFDEIIAPEGGITLSDQPLIDDASRFLDGPSEMAGRIRGHDWGSTPLGALDSWPQSLKTATGLLVASPIPIVMLWGPSGVMLYNDAYSVFAGGRHPALLGGNVLEGWPEVADFNAHVMKVGLAGGTLAYRDQELTLYRNGRPEQVWMDLDYWPVPGEDGKPAGVIATVVETTAKVLADRRRDEANERLDVALSAGRGVGTWHWDVVTDRVVADARFADLYGVDPRVAETGAPLADFFVAMDPSDSDRVQSEIQHALATGETFSSEYRLIQPDGSVRWVAAEGRAILAEDGSPLRFPGVTFDITERKQREVRQAALIDLADILSNLTDPVVIAHAAAEVVGKTLGASRVGYGLIDASAETILVENDWTAPGQPSVAGLHGFRTYGAYVETLMRGEPVRITSTETDPRTAADPQPLLAYNIRALMDVPVMEDGRVVAQMLVHSATERDWSIEEAAWVRDVAERTRATVTRREAERQLDESEVRYRALFEAMDEGFCIIEFFDGPHGPDSDYIHVEANPAYEAQAGIPNVVGQKLREMVGDEAQTWVDRYGAVLKTGVPIRFEQELEATGRWLELSAFRVEPPERRQVAVLFQDLTGRRRAEIALRQSEAELRRQGEELARLNAQLEILLAGSMAERDRLWMLSQDMLARADYGGAMSAVNPAWTRILGWTEQELLTNPYADIIDQEDLPATAAALKEMQRTGQPTRFENRILTKDNVWTPVGWTVAPEPDGINFIAVGRDLTEDKARESQLALAQEALRQSHKMEAVGQLTGGIAHDFNNLLAGISGSLELLSRRLSEGRLNGMERYIDAAQGSAQRAASLTQRLLAFSRRQTLDPKATDVNRLIAGMEDLIRRSVGPNVEVEVVGAGGLWATRIDPSQLENALLNLCINARDAMAPDGGRLTIETANKWLDDRAGRERDLAPGQYISLCVSDTGTGMTPEIQAQVFDPFFTTKPLGQGTGLGLSMIHGFVRQSGGQVRIYSEPGKGTTMCLYLPRFNGDLDNPDDVESPLAAHGGHGETVLVVDDEETVRMLVAEVLTEAGYRVLEAPDGPAGLDILRSDGRIDLLITDVGLPGGMNGRQVADAAREVRPALKVLFITGYAENAAVGNGHLDPGMEVMTKPFVMAALSEKVRDMVER